MIPSRPDLRLPHAPSSLHRAVRNAFWLLGGKGVGGLLSLCYLALATRGLGIAGFGAFATILAYGQAWANLASFQSWQTIVHFGAGHVASGQPDRVRRLAGFTALLDGAAGLVAAGIAIWGIFAFGASFGWSVRQMQLGAGFCLSLPVSQRGAAIGILRLADRFDHAAAAELALPGLRLCGAAAAYAAGGDLAYYLLAWIVADLGCTLCLWAAALRTLGSLDGGRHAPRGRLLDAVAENPGMLRFLAGTSLNSSIGMVWQQLPVLAVGLCAGPATAGIYRLAAQLGTALTKPVTLLSRALYPEFAGIVASGDTAKLSRLLGQVMLRAGLFGLAILLLVLFGGRAMLEIVGGPQYAVAYPLLLLLTLASAISLAGFGLEPALSSAGRPWSVFAARGLATIVYLGFMLVMVPAYGPIGMAWGNILAAIVLLSLLRHRFASICSRLSPPGHDGATL